MHKRIRTWLHASLITASLVLLISLTATGQTNGTAEISRPTPNVVNDCESQLRIALERLDKTLDAFEKAKGTITAFQSERESYERLLALDKQLLAVKDLIIAEQDRLIKVLKKPKSQWRKILETAQRVALIATGILITKL